MTTTNRELVGPPRLGERLTAAIFPRSGRSRLAADANSTATPGGTSKPPGSHSRARK